MIGDDWINIRKTKADWVNFRKAEVTIRSAGRQKNGTNKALTLYFLSSLLSYIFIPIYFYINSIYIF